MTTNQKISLSQISLSGSANGQVLASNGTALYWATGGNGYTGSQGDVGFTGSQGLQGNLGYTGSQGSTGATGATGFTGSQGSSGSQGTSGFTGSQGVGFTGSAGSQGTTGFVGSQGSTGFTGSQGPAGVFGGASFNYNFSTNTTHTSTPNGYFNFNNTAFASVTTLYLDYIDSLGANSYSFLQTIDDSTSAIKGHFSVRDVANSLNYAMFAIVGTHTEDVDHFDIPVSYVSGVTSFANGTNTIITFARTGDRGDTGYTGSIGSLGYTGSVGSTGATGFTGSIGSLGYTGSTGLQGANSLYTTSNTAPLSPTAGDRWFHTDYGIELVYTNDGDSSQWVEIAASGFMGQIGPIGYTGSQPASMAMNVKSTSYTLVSSDDTKLVSTSSNVIINPNVFTTNGATVSIYNSSTSGSITLIQNTVTMYLAGTTTTGNRILANQGIASIICVDSVNNKFVITGSGLT